MRRVDSGAFLESYIGDASTTGQIEWGPPQSLPSVLPPVADFDQSMLPNTLRPFVEDVAERMQCPPDFPAVSLLVSISSVIGRQIGIHPKQLDSWAVVPNLWGGIVGRPGIMKSPALGAATAFISHLEDKARRQHEEAITVAAATQMVDKEERKNTEQEIKKLVKAGNREAAHRMALRSVADESDPPVRRRYKTSDATVEKIGELLRDNPRGILVIRDELTGWLKALEREGREEARAFYLEAWNGDGGFTFDRIGRGTVDIPAATVSILGGIQPGPLSHYLARAAQGGAGDDGLLQRFQLLVWPDVAKTWRNIDRRPDGRAMMHIMELFERLDQIDAKAMMEEKNSDMPQGPTDKTDKTSRSTLSSNYVGSVSTSPADSEKVSAASSIPCLRFDESAQRHFNNWRAGLEARIRSGDENPSFEAHLAKYRSMVPSLALIFHLVEKPQGGLVGNDALHLAIRWADYLESHATRLYSQIMEPALAAALELDKHLAAGDLGNTFKARDVYRRGWSGLDKESTAEALATLEEFGRVASVSSNRGGAGRPAVTWHINPAVLEDHS